MEVEEALGILGVNGSADPKTVKRAYLSKLKLHKPERDPEGFKRLRTAYELVERLSYWMGPQVVEPNAPQDERPRALQVMLQGAAFEAPGAERAAANTPLNAAPGDAGHMPPEIQSTSTDPTSLLRQAEVLLNDGRSEDATERALEVIAQLASAPYPAGLVSSLLSFLCRLQVRGHLREAVRAFQALHSVLRSAGLELKLGPHLSVRLSLVGELCLLPSGFPASVRSRLGRALDESDLAVAEREIRVLLRFRWFTARRASSQLRTNAPMLFQMFGEVMTPLHPLFWVAAFGYVAWTLSAHVDLVTGRSGQWSIYLFMDAAFAIAMGLWFMATKGNRRWIRILVVGLVLAGGMAILLVPWRADVKAIVLIQVGLALFRAFGKHFTRQPWA